MAKLSCHKFRAFLHAVNHELTTIMSTYFSAVMVNLAAEFPMFLIRIVLVEQYCKKYECM